MQSNIGVIFCSIGMFFKIEDSIRVVFLVRSSTW